MMLIMRLFNECRYERDASRDSLRDVVYNGLSGTLRMKRGVYVYIYIHIAMDYIYVYMLYEVEGLRVSSRVWSCEE